MEEMVMPYLDDLLVFGPTFEVALERTTQLLERLRWGGLSLSAKKVKLMSTYIDFLGHRLTRTGVTVCPSKVEAIVSIDGKTINNATAVRSFLGMANYYRKYIRGFAEICAPLHALTKTGVDVAEESQKPEAQAAIAALKQSLTSAPVLMLPRYDKQMIVKTDASYHAVGGVLSQEDETGHERVVAYMGRKLTPAEAKYTVTEIECLAAVEAIKQWRPYLWGRRFVLQTDHSALKWLHTMKDSVEGGSSSRLMRWLLRLQEMDMEVQHKPGITNSDADGVSRLTQIPPTEEDPTAQVNNLRETEDESADEHRRKILESPRFASLTGSGK